MERPASRQRTHRSFMVDPRFLVGIGLVVVSVLGVTWLVSTVDKTTDVYVASSTVVSGERLTSDDLTVIHVRLGSATDRYLRPGDLEKEGVLSVRSIEKGELVPVEAVGENRAEDETRVVITVAGPVPSTVDEASRVTLWASAAASEGTGFTAPVVLVDQADVVAVRESTGLVATAADVQVELRVPRESVASVLEATANGAALAIVPDDEPLGG
jgi:hypothetical protein